VNTPWRARGRPAYASFVKHNKYPQDQSKKPVAVADGNENSFAPSPDEVARKAYFSYVNQGSRDGHEVQHWLAAEAELIAERDRTRRHGFHNQT
jgi:hypothetical protein